MMPDQEPVKRRISENPFRFLYAAAPVVPTGNDIVVFKRGVSTKDAMKELQAQKVPVASTGDFSTKSYDLEGVLNSASGLMLERLGVAILRTPKSDKLLHAAEQKLKQSRSVQAIIPEFYVFSYVKELSSDDGTINEDNAECTWGVRAVGALNCRNSGRGIKLGVLDSGFDRSHPDFAGRKLAFGAHSAMTLAEMRLGTVRTVPVPRLASRCATRL
jgi:hypothetical protein